MPQSHFVLGDVAKLTANIEILLALGIEPEMLTASLERHRDTLRLAGRENAAAILDALLDRVRESRRQH